MSDFPDNVIFCVTGANIFGSCARLARARLQTRTSQPFVYCAPYQLCNTAFPQLL